jgi:hypothetical protein
LYWQLADFENARQDRVAGNETQLVQARESDVEAQDDPQHEPIQLHRSRDALGR